jgi:putative hydrolase of the HAD superfamily
MMAVEIRLRLTRHALSQERTPSTFAAEGRGFKIGRSKRSIEIPIVWPETEFAGLFDSAVFSSRERIKKPARQIYQLACERLGAAPEDCLYVADGENHELKAAAELGMSPVLIRPNAHQPQGELRREAREWQGVTISSLPEVLGLTTKCNAW